MVERRWPERDVWFEFAAAALLFGVWRSKRSSLALAFAGLNQHERSREWSKRDGNLATELPKERQKTRKTKIDFNAFGPWRNTGERGRMGDLPPEQRQAQGADM